MPTRCFVILGIMCFSLLGLTGCEEEDKYEFEVFPSEVAISLSPESGPPRRYSDEGTTNSLWRWETLITIREIAGGVSTLHSGTVEIFTEDPNNPGTFDQLQFTKDLNTDELVSLFGDLEIETYSEIVAAYQITNSRAIPFRARFTFDVDITPNVPNLTLQTVQIDYQGTI